MVVPASRSDLPRLGMFRRRTLGTNPSASRAIPIGSVLFRAPVRVHLPVLMDAVGALPPMALGPREQGGLLAGARTSLARRSDRRMAIRRARARSHPEAPHMVNLVTEDPVLRAPCNLVARRRCVMHAWVVAAVTAMGPPAAVHHMAREREGRVELLCGVLARLRGAGVLPPSMAWTPVWSSACSPSCCC